MPRTSNKKKSKNNNKTSSQAAKKNPTGKNDTAEEKKRIDELQMLHSSIDHFYEFNPSCQYDQEKLIDGLKWEKNQNDDDEEAAMSMQRFDFIYNQTSTKTGYDGVRARVSHLWVDFPIIGIWYMSSTPLF